MNTLFFMNFSISYIGFQDNAFSFCNFLIVLVIFSNYEKSVQILNIESLASEQECQIFSHNPKLWALVQNIPSFDDTVPILSTAFIPLVSSW